MRPPPDRFQHLEITVSRIILPSHDEFILNSVLQHVNLLGAINGLGPQRTAHLFRGTMGMNDKMSVGDVVEQAISGPTADFHRDCFAPVVAAMGL